MHITCLIPHKEKHKSLASVFERHTALYDGLSFVLSEKTTHVIGVDRDRHTMLDPAAAKPKVFMFDPAEAYSLRALDNDEDDDEEATGKDSAPTRHKLGWCRHALDKLLAPPAPITRMFRPVLQQTPLAAAALLRQVSGTYIVLDIENSPKSAECYIIGFVCGDSPAVQVVPIFGANRKLIYPRKDVATFIAALAQALSRNLVVAHNASFDLAMLAYRYRVPIPENVYDTMLAQHRIEPLLEKSLDHCIRYWLNCPSHKGDFVIPFTAEQYRQLAEYNAKDVFLTREIFLRQRDFISSRPGLRASVEQANSTVPMYLAAGIKGFYVPEDLLAKEKDKLQRRSDSLRALAKALARDLMPDFSPGSSQQCAKLFYEKLSYEPQGETASGRPQMNKAAMQKLRLRYPHNPLLRVILAYREVTKALSMFQFFSA